MGFFLSFFFNFMIVEVHNIITMIKVNILLVRFVSYSPVHFGACKWQPLRGREFLISIICCACSLLATSVLLYWTKLFLLHFCLDYAVSTMSSRFMNVLRTCIIAASLFFAVFFGHDEENTHCKYLWTVALRTESNVRASGGGTNVRWNRRHLGGRSKLAYESMT